MGKSVLEEAMADTKLLKETALENAKNILVEAISPKIREFVEDQIGESDIEIAEMPMYEKEEDPEDEMEMPEMPEEGMYEAKDDDDEDEEETKDEAVDLDENEEVVEITQEDLKQAFSEVLGDIKAEATVSKTFGDVEDPTPKTAGGKGQTGIADEKTGEHLWDKETPPAAEDWTIPEATYRKKVSQLFEAVKVLKKQLKEYREACTFLKRNLQEVNLFNSKLLYTNKLMQNSSLNKEQRMGIIESIDAAQSLREVQLVYKSLSESLKIAGVMSEGRRSKSPKSSSMARSSGTSSTLNESLENESGDSWAKRMQTLSGLVK